MRTKTMISICGAAAMLSLSTPAHAYLDPATGSIILQAAIGAIASGVLFFRTSIYRLKSVFSRGGKTAEANEE